MKITYDYRYVKDGCDEPDEHGRWAIHVHVYPNVKKGLPQLTLITQKHIPSLVCVINKNNPGSHFKYKTSLCSSEDAANTGVFEKVFYSETIEEIKVVIEEQLKKMELFWSNLK